MRLSIYNKNMNLGNKLEKTTVPINSTTTVINLLCKEIKNVVNNYRNV